MAQPGVSSGQPGVVRNSALSFVEDTASAQGQTGDYKSHPVAQTMDSSKDESSASDRMVPAGLKALCEAYSQLYPDQPNPLQVTTRLKYWLGGQDPLDYISMYWNPGKPEENIPAHWHYVSFGLSDLHGDGRVHAPPDRVGNVDEGCVSSPSGTGMELTMRLAADLPSPPLWPAALLQALARYIFTTGNKFCAGDHISWHAALDGNAKGRSRVRHLLVAHDPQLPALRTAHGAVAFLQVVGCTGKELRAAQRGSCIDVLRLISEDTRCGAGAWLVTKVSRRRSARGVRHGPGPGAASAGAAGGAGAAGAAGAAAQLAGVSASLAWRAVNSSVEGTTDCLTPSVERQIANTLQRGLQTMSFERGAEGHMSTDSFEMSSIERALPHIPDLMQGSWRDDDDVEYFHGVHLLMNAEGASLLPLAIDGRLLHGRHFTWRCGPTAVTVLPGAVPGAAATPTQPYAARRHWLQVVIPKPLALDMSAKVSKFDTLSAVDSESDSEGESERAGETISLPLTLAWPEYNLKITVVQDLDVL